MDDRQHSSTGEPLSLLSDWLTELGVPHTEAYTEARFATMPFKSLFGLGQLLKEYGIESQGYGFTDKSDIRNLQPPFVAVMPAGMVIVKELTPDNIVYLSQGVPETIPYDRFMDAWTGKAFCAYPSPGSAEPDYPLHRRDELMRRLRDRGLLAGVTALFLYLFISNGLWRDISTVLITLLDLGGLALTYMLVQKSLRIKNAAADKVCKVLQEGGCDTVLEMKASKFFGIFGWSEVGFAYFSVSLLALLMFPQWTRYLALCNLCCLPFTFWSIWYQKFRAKVWCTLCVSVQATLWLLFFCYLGGGWFAGIFPLRIEFFVLGATYLTTLLLLNKILPRFGADN